MLKKRLFQDTHSHSFQISKSRAANGTPGKLVSLSQLQGKPQTLDMSVLEMHKVG